MNKLAKLKYLPNNFEVIEEGDYVICAISGKKIPLESLNYWNVDEQEAYFSYVEASIKKEKDNIYFFHLLCVHIHCSGFFNIIFSKILFKCIEISS